MRNLLRSGKSTARKQEFTKGRILSTVGRVAPRPALVAVPPREDGKRMRPSWQVGDESRQSSGAPLRRRQTTPGRQIGFADGRQISFESPCYQPQHRAKNGKNREWQIGDDVSEITVYRPG
jgi:hypothetical protein